MEHHGEGGLSSLKLSDDLGGRSETFSPSGTVPKPLISIVIPAFNVTPYIGEALQSVFAQTYSNYEVIVINDGCPDTAGLEAVLEPFRSRITYLQQKNGGLASARNTAIRASHGEWIALLDSDDLWEPDYLESQWAVLSRNPSIDVLYCDARFFGDPAWEGQRFMDVSPSEGPVDFESLVEQRCNVMVSAMIRRSMAEKVGLFDDTLRRSEDFDLWVRILLAGGRISYQQKVLVRYRRRHNSLSSNDMAMLESYHSVLSKLLRQYADSLLPAQRSCVERRMQWIVSMQHYYRARAALLDGETDRARHEFTEANRHLRSPKLLAIQLGLRVAPGLMSRFARKRHSSVAVPSV